MKIRTRYLMAVLVLLLANSATAVAPLSAVLSTGLVFSVIYAAITGLWYALDPDVASFKSPRG